ncbi:MAG TPA: type II secretion system protein M [Chromatiales bacterium]|nr:type II secretion system protein M [Chromatiales bacterium]
MMDSLQTWFSGLAPRERILVSVAAVLTIIAIVVLGIVQPLTRKADRSQEIITEQETLLDELEQVATRLGPQRGTTGNTSAPASQSLVLIVDRTTRGHELAKFLTRSQPDGNEKIRLRFEGAPFDRLVEWLVEVQERHGLAVESANIDQATEPGRVNCNLVLVHSGL